MIIWAGAAPAQQDRRPEARALRHRARARRQHPAGAEGLGTSGHRGRGLLLLRLPQEPDERLARGRAPEALQGAARLLHRRRHGGRRRGRRRRSRRPSATDTEKLIAAMEGMEFDTPKGKMMFRKEDHQAMQPMYHFRVKNGAGRMGPARARARDPGRRNAGADPQAKKLTRGGRPALIAVRDPGTHGWLRSTHPRDARADHPLRRPRRRERGELRVPARHADRDRRAQRRRQDDLLQPRSRGSSGPRRAACYSRATTSRGLPRPSARGAASAARSSSPTCFPA